MKQSFIYKLPSGEVVAVFDDLTDQKRTEEALAASEKQYRELAELLPQTIFELDKKANVTFANAHGYKSIGHSREDIEKGLKASQLFVPEDRKRVKNNIRRIMSGEAAGGNEYTALRKNGSTFPAVVHSSPIIRNGNPVGLRGILVDISERKRAEEEVQESEKRYRNLVDNANSIILHWNRKGNIVFMNRYGLVFFGYKKSSSQE